MSLRTRGGDREGSSPEEETGRGHCLCSECSPPASDLYVLSSLCLSFPWSVKQRKILSWGVQGKA